MNENIKNGVEEYQCPGCTSGRNISCYKKSENSIACGEHRAGTAITFIGKIFLGMPIGFNRLGVELGGGENMPIEIFESFEKRDWDYNKWNIPVWKHLNENGHTFVRGLSPRTNRPFLHIFLKDCMNRIDCFEVTQELINEMD